MSDERFFYQLMIPGLNLMGTPHPTGRLQPEMSFLVYERLSARFDAERIPTKTELARRYRFSLRKSYPIPEGICGLYELEEISR